MAETKKKKTTTKRKPKSYSKNGKPLGRPITRELKPTLLESVGVENPTQAENQKEKNNLDMTKSSISKLTSIKQCNPDIVAQFLKESYILSKQPPVHTDQETIDRLDWYFEDCYKQHRIPTVEDMTLALGIHRNTLNDWANGELGPSRSDIIKRAKQILAGIDGKLVASGELNPLTYIFRSKNYYGMVDKQEVVHETGNPFGDTPDQNQLEEKYKQSIPED